MRAAGAVLAFLGGCSIGNPYYLDLPDIHLDAPEDLEGRLAAYRSGSEPWHGDPLLVADRTLRQELEHLPWKHQPFDPVFYEKEQSPEWGDYVTRGYTYPSGSIARYRVKLRAYREIWYPVQVSRYRIFEDPGEDEKLLEHFSR